MTTGTDAGVVPEIYMDETTPPPRAMPDDWIVRKGDAAMIDVGPGYYDEKIGGTLALTHGEAVIFSRLYTYPAATLIFGENGEWRCEPPAPADAENVMVAGEPDTMMGNIDDLAYYLAENGDGDPGEEHDVRFYTWTDEIWSFDAESGKFVRGAA